MQCLPIITITPAQHDTQYRWWLVLSYSGYDSQEIPHAFHPQYFGHDPQPAEDFALERARQIAKITGAHLHLLVCDRRNAHGDYLNMAAEKLKEKGFSVSTQQAWMDSYHETIIHAQRSENCRLVVKQHFPENPLKRALLTPDDWKLLRYCPVPVLIVKTAKYGRTAPFWLPWMLATAALNTALCTPA